MPVDGCVTWLIDCKYYSAAVSLEPYSLEDFHNLELPVYAGFILLLDSDKVRQLHPECSPWTLAYPSSC